MKFQHKKPPLIECIPNFSEGRNREIIDAISSSIQSVAETTLLHTDVGYDANRTVMTFVGTPEAVCNSAFQAIRTASQLIDMSKHTGTHPRIGATDVCPLVPLSNITMNETVHWARQLAQRVGEELNIPVYCYENAAYRDERKNLAQCRAGEYEGIAQKLLLDEWIPDYGPRTFNERSGISIIGARPFLAAYNVNLNTTSKEIAHKIAQEVRESGYKDSAGVHHPGILKQVKALGWYVETYKNAQVSMNICDLNITPLHVAFETVKKVAEKYGVRVTGSELIGMLPEKCLIDAGAFYTKKPCSKEKCINIAIYELNLNENTTFDAAQRLIITE